MYSKTKLGSMFGAIFAVLAIAVLTTRHTSVETITILLLTVRFCTFASFDFSSFDSRLLSQHLETFGVELDVSSIDALAIFAAEELVGEALAVKFEAFGLFAIAFHFAFLCVLL